MQLTNDSLLVVGFIHKRIDPQLFIALLMVIGAILSAWIPWNRSLIGLLISFFLHGGFFGMADVVSNIFIMHIWGKETAPFMQGKFFI